MRPPETPPNPGDREHTGGAGRRPGEPAFDLPIVDPDDDEDVLEDLEDEDDLDVEDEALSEVIEEEPRTVLITGACGNIGRKLCAAWTDVYDLVLIDRRPGDDEDEDVIVADLGQWDNDWITHFHGVDTVVHLAANPDSDAGWDDLIGPNLDVLANVLNAAALAGVERVIFASSNHVMGGHRDLDDEPISVDREPRPDGPYGAAKLFGERLGKSLAMAFDLTFIALRIGWVQPGNNRPETLPDDWSRKLWLSNNDLVQLFDCAVEAEIEDRSFIVVNGMSRNHGMRWDLSDAAELLGYLPVDDAFAPHPAGHPTEGSHP
jgi:NAD(P)-dependent dehydrogenase (short-subunit alcohol dehydrogenase family)